MIWWTCDDLMNMWWFDEHVMIWWTCDDLMNMWWFDEQAMKTKLDTLASAEKQTHILSGIYVLNQNNMGTLHLPVTVHVHIWAQGVDSQNGPIRCNTLSNRGSKTISLCACACLHLCIAHVSVCMDTFQLIYFNKHSSIMIWFIWLLLCCTLHTHTDRKEGNVLFNNTLNTFYLWLYDIRHMVKNHSYMERGNPVPHMGYSSWLAARVILYASSHRQDNTYHKLCYTSCGPLAGMRNSPMGSPWRIDTTTHRTMNKRSYHGATSRSHTQTEEKRQK